jgi:hypothetical protein
VQLTGLLLAQIQVSYSHCGVWGGDVEGHETARQLTQTVGRRKITTKILKWVKMILLSIEDFQEK